jgi:ribosomal protein L23
MAKFIYKGKVNGNDVIYKEGCFHGLVDKMEGNFSQNIMSVVTETGRKFRFRSWIDYYYIRECLEENISLKNDAVNEVVIKEKGKKTLKYNSRDIEDRTTDGKRACMVLEKATEMYNGIRRQIINELREQYSHNEKSKNNKLKKRILSEEEIRNEVEDMFNTDPKINGLSLYKENSKRFITYFSKMGKDKKKDLLNVIFSCDYDNKEVIEWLNKNELDLLREAGFNS